MFLAAFVVASLMIFQATRESSAHVLLSADLLKRDATEALNRIRVGGRVAELPIDYTVEPSIKLAFRIHDPEFDPTIATVDNTVAVVYEGLMPDMFSAGRDVIIDGRYENGVLYASNLLTQCPSKYEPPEPDPVATP